MVFNHLKERNSTEKVIGTLHEVSGHSFDLLYDLFFTPERVVAVLIQSPFDIKFSISPWAFLFSNWFTRHKEQLDRKKIMRERHHQIETMTLDELISTNPNNFEIPYVSIDSVEIKSKLFEYHLTFQISVLPAKKLRKDFTLKKEQVPEARRVLEKVLATKIKIK